MTEKVNSWFSTIQEAYSWLTEGSQKGAVTLSKILLALTVVLGLVTYGISTRYFDLVDDARAAIYLQEEAEHMAEELAIKNEQLLNKNAGLNETIESLVRKHPESSHHESEHESTYEVVKQPTIVNVDDAARRAKEHKEKRLVDIINH